MIRRLLPVLLVVGLALTMANALGNPLVSFSHLGELAGVGDGRLTDGEVEVLLIAASWSAWSALAMTAARRVLTPSGAAGRRGGTREERRPRAAGRRGGTGDEGRPRAAGRRGGSGAARRRSPRRLLAAAAASGAASAPDAPTPLHARRRSREGEKMVRPPAPRRWAKSKSRSGSDGSAPISTLTTVHDANHGTGSDDDFGDRTRPAGVAMKPRPTILEMVSLSLDGDDESVDDLLHRLVVESTSATEGPVAESLLVGFGDELDCLDGITVVSSPVEALERARSARDPLVVFVGRVEGRRVLSALVALVALAEERGRERAEVAVAGPVAAAVTRDLGRDEGYEPAPSPPMSAPLAVVLAGGETGTRWRMDLGSIGTDGEPDLKGTDVVPGLLGEDRQPRPVGAEVEAEGASTTIDPGADVSDPAPGQLDHEPPAVDVDGARPSGAKRPDGIASSVRSPPTTVASSVRSPPTTVEVNVLGPVEVRGSASPFYRRPRLTELVVYLAMHPQGATTDSWSTALWPERRVSDSTLSNRLSEARIALGTASDGYAHLRKRGGRYLLGPEVTTDWAVFNELAGREDIDSWCSAIELVRGRPFEGIREPGWTLLEGMVPAMESAIVELACRLGEHLLEDGDPLRAEAAARRAMLACPWDERLYRLVMRAADAVGNRAGVDAALRQLARVLESDGEPLAVVHFETVRLYRELTRPRAKAPVEEVSTAR